MIYLLVEKLCDEQKGITDDQMSQIYIILAMKTLENQSATMTYLEFW